MYPYNKVYFLTSNKHKVEEIKSYLKGMIHVEELPFDFIEVQSLDPKSVVINKISQAIMKYPDKKLLVEDSGIIIKELSKKHPFPGVYSKDFYEALGLEKIISLLNDNRDAVMYSYIAYYDTTSIRIFKGEVKGRIANEVRGEEGFAYDFIFIPEGYDKTFAEMYDIKKEISHRSKVCKEFIRFLKSKTD